MAVCLGHIDLTATIVRSSVDAQPDFHNASLLPDGKARLDAPGPLLPGYCPCLNFTTKLPGRCRWREVHWVLNRILITLACSLAGPFACLDPGASRFFAPGMVDVFLDVVGRRVSSRVCV